ncbi:MAG: WXG100 family type VII secretion target [Acidimicrobiales bacterium]
MGQGGGGSIAVTTEEVRALGDSCVSTGSAIAGELNSLLARVGGVTNGSWQGIASGSFNQYFNDAKRGWDMVEQALQQMSQQLKAAATGYDETEQGIAGGFQRG